MPFKSQAQRRKFAKMLVDGEISPETFEEWNRETGGAELPERVAKKASGKKKSARKASGKKASGKKASGKKSGAKKARKTTRKRAAKKKSRS